MRTLPAALLALLATGCIEDTLLVTIRTEIHADGSCSRRAEYRLERIDTERANQRIPIPAKDDALKKLHRFPKGPEWTVEDTMEDEVHVVTVAGVLASPNDIGGDYFRARTPKARAAHNQVSLAMETSETGALYEYSEVFMDPVSPIAVARQLARALVHRDDAFARALQADLPDAKLHRGAIRKAYRDTFVLPLSQAVSALARRRTYGLRERRELEALFRGTYETDLAAAILAMLPGHDLETVKKAVDSALESLVPGLDGEMASVGLPMEGIFPEYEETRRRVHFIVTLVMPQPITRANTCVQGDTATWEFDGEDLYGRGFDLWAKAGTP